MWEKRIVSGAELRALIKKVNSVQLCWNIGEGKRVFHIDITKKEARRLASRYAEFLVGIFTHDYGQILHIEKARDDDVIQRWEV